MPSFAQDSIPPQHFYDNESGVYWFPVKFARTANGAIRRLKATLRHECFYSRFDVEQDEYHATQVFGKFNGDQDYMTVIDPPPSDERTDQLPQLFWQVTAGGKGG